MLSYYISSKVGDLLHFLLDTIRKFFLIYQTFKLIRTKIVNPENLNQTFPLISCWQLRLLRFLISKLCTNLWIFDLEEVEISSHRRLFVFWTVSKIQGWYLTISRRLKFFLIQSLNCYKNIFKFQAKFVQIGPPLTSAIIPVSQLS